MQVNPYFTRLACSALLLCGALGSGACATILGVDDRVLEESSDGGDSSTADADAGGIIAPGHDADAMSPDSSGKDADAAAPTFFCRGVAVSTCAGCSAGTAACRGTCVSDCANECDPATLGCFGCSSGTPLGTCEIASTAASCIAVPTYVHCACAMDAGTCPGANQVCVMNECRTCGEPMTVDEVCRDGTGMKKCKSATDPDPTKRLRCR